MYSVDAGKAFIQMIQRKNQLKKQTDLNALDGDFHWRPSKLNPYASSCDNVAVARYEAYLIKIGKTIANTRHNIHLIAGFLAYMESIGISSLSMIKAEHIHERFIVANDKAGFARARRCFSDTPTSTD